MPMGCDGRGKPRPYREDNKRSIFVPTLYLTEEYSFVRRDSEDKLLVEIPARKGKDGSSPSPARKRQPPLYTSCWNATSRSLI